MKSIATTLCLDFYYLGDFLGQESIQPPLKRTVLETHSCSTRKYSETQELFVCLSNRLHAWSVHKLEYSWSKPILELLLSTQKNKTSTGVVTICNDKRKKNALEVLYLFSFPLVPSCARILCLVCRFPATENAMHVITVDQLCIRRAHFQQT